MTAVTVTNRELKNKATGIDICVPQYEHIPGPFGGSYVYHVIVVTELFYFKNPGKHKESDVVQFMIPEKFEVFEELCQKLSQKFPSVVLPSAPKKTLIMNDSVVSGRRQHMETVLTLVAKTPKLACSSLVLEFLRARRGHKEINRLESTHKANTNSEEEITKEEFSEDVDLFASGDNEDGPTTEEIDDDLNSPEKSTASPSSSSSTAKGFSVFGPLHRDEDNDADIADLFIPAGAQEKPKLSLDIEDNSQLLNIEDDLDKLFASKGKPQKPPKPGKPVPKPRLKPKPDLKPKPALKPKFEEAAGKEEELFGRTPPKQIDASPAAKKTESKPEEQDLFVQARKQSFRKPLHEEETLDDIFKAPSQATFASTEDDDELFKQSVTTESVDSMTVDDIASYIELNKPGANVKLDLF